MAGTLERLAEEALTSRGVDLLIARGALRQYIRTQPLDKILREIRMIEKHYISGTLLSVGLNRYMQDALIERMKEIQK